MARAPAVLIAALVGLLTLAAPALAQEDPYPPDEGAVAGVSQTSVQPCQTITASGDGWQANSTVTIRWLSTGAALATATVNADGTFSAQVTIPSDATVGAHTIRVSGTNTSGNARSVDIAVTVQAGDQCDDDGDDDDAGGLPPTGGTFTPAAALAALLLVVGGGGLFASRRLSRSQTRSQAT